MGFFLSLFTGPVISVFGNALVKPLLDFLGAKTNADAEKFTAQVGADRDVAVATLQAHVAAAEDAKEVSMLRWGWWGERYLLLAAALPPVIHSGAVYLDSTFRFGWNVPRAPGVYEGQELTIIASVVGYSVIKSGFGAMIGRLK